MYSERLLDHFQNPRNVGRLEPPGLAVEVENPACGDVMRLEARLEGDRVKETRFQTKGCTASIAAGSAVTELIGGRSLAEIGRLQAADVEGAVGGLSAESKHAAVLAVDAIKALVAAAKAARSQA